MLARIFCFLSIYLLVGISAQAAWHSGTGAILDDVVEIELWQEDPAIADRCIAAVKIEMARVNSLIDADDPESQVSQINAHAADQAVIIGAELYGLIEKALRFSPVTRGAFDISYASVGFLYDYDKRVRPDAEQTEQALQVVDYRLVEINRANQSIRFLKQGVRIDIGGIAKGHAVDRAAKILGACGAMHAFISAGGDTRVVGDRRGKPWVVGIRNPRGADHDMLVRIPLDDQAISTSGDYERYFEQDGVRYHKIINPRTGGSPSDVRSASVVGPDGIWCDALATGVFVLGVREGLEVIEALKGYEAVIVDNNGDLHKTSKLKTVSPEPDCSEKARKKELISQDLKGSWSFHVH